MCLRSVLLALLTCLPGFAAADGWEVSAGRGSSHHLRHAGGALYTSFFGEPPGTGDDFGLSDLTSQPGGVAVDAASHWALRRSGTLHEGGARLRYSVGLEHGRARIDLPGGLGIFTDPALARVESWTLEARLIADSPPLRLGRAELRHGAEIGALATRYRARLTSALLDIRTDASMATPFVGLGITLSTTAAPRMGLRAGGRAYGNGGREARLELFAGF
ncbi:hypothetical protein [Mesobacterium pallidum]|uniref:hypothetical protein n=1 Tax=Mesobacterium pallidum TaxID=2872037 RepID=UPI001EE25C7E|nr:hypothetical protein [Mesobacterium pallidum]